MAAKGTININGKEYKLRYGVGLIGLAVKEENTDMQSLFESLQTNPFYIAPRLLTYALRKGNPDETFTFEQVEDWIDDDGGFGSQILLKFIEDFSNSMTTGLPPEPEKKKAAPKKK